MNLSHQTQSLRDNIFLSPEEQAIQNLTYYGKFFIVCGFDDSWWPLLYSKLVEYLNSIYSRGTLDTLAIESDQCSERIETIITSRSLSPEIPKTVYEISKKLQKDFYMQVGREHIHPLFVSSEVPVHFSLERPDENNIFFPRYTFQEAVAKIDELNLRMQRIKFSIGAISQQSENTQDEVYKNMFESQIESLEKQLQMLEEMKNTLEESLPELKMSQYLLLSQQHFPNRKELELKRDNIRYIPDENELILHTETANKGKQGTETTLLEIRDLLQHILKPSEKKEDIKQEVRTSETQESDNAITYDEDGYDEEGFDKNGYDENGYDEDGFNSDGLNEESSEQRKCSQYIQMQNKLQERNSVFVTEIALNELDSRILDKIYSDTIEKTQKVLTENSHQAIESLELIVNKEMLSFTYNIGGIDLRVESEILEIFNNPKTGNIECILDICFKTEIPDYRLYRNYASSKIEKNKKVFQAYLRVGESTDNKESIEFYYKVIKEYYKNLEDHITSKETRSLSIGGLFCSLHILRKYLFSDEDGHIDWEEEKTLGENLEGLKKVENIFSLISRISHERQQELIKVFGGLSVFKLLSKTNSTIEDFYSFLLSQENLILEDSCEVPVETPFSDIDISRNKVVFIDGHLWAKNHIYHFENKEDAPLLKLGQFTHETQRLRSVKKYKKYSNEIILSDYFHKGCLHSLSKKYRIDIIHDGDISYGRKTRLALKLSHENKGYLIRLQCFASWNEEGSVFTPEITYNIMSLQKDSETELLQLQKEVREIFIEQKS